MSEIGPLLESLERLGQRLDQLLNSRTPENDWTASAYRWRKSGPQSCGHMEAISHPQRLDLDDLLGIDHQKAELERNTRQFLAGQPANNALLWGSRGTGKSSLVKGLLSRYANDGLRVIEVDRTDLADLPDIVEPLYGRSEHYLIFSDDLSFEADDPSYKALKATIEGTLAAPPENVLIYATSNRRHLLPEYRHENLDTQMIDGEIHHGEAVEEKISLSERFGLWLAFHPFTQDQYLEIVARYLERFGAGSISPEIRTQALRWALARGSRSGRVAWQFARDHAGRKALQR